MITSFQNISRSEEIKDCNVKHLWIDNMYNTLNQLPNYVNKFVVTLWWANLFFSGQLQDRVSNAKPSLIPWNILRYFRINISTQFTPHEMCLALPKTSFSSQYSILNLLRIGKHFCCSFWHFYRHFLIFQNVTHIAEFYHRYTVKNDIMKSNWVTI